MLLRFGLQNFASFRDLAELSFVSSALGDAPSFRIPSTRASHGILPVVGVWGPNASGKSNLLRGLLTFRDLVEHSFVGYRPDQRMPWQPFASLRDRADALTRMEVDLDVDGVRYHYGMTFTASGFVEEWLDAWPKNRQQQLFYRDHGEREPWYFSQNLRGQKHKIAEATRRNSLFLSVAAQYNHEQLTPIYSAIVSGIRRLDDLSGTDHPVFHRDALVVQPSMRRSVLDFLAAADLGVVGLETVELPDPVSTASVTEELSSSERRSSSTRRGTVEIHLEHGDPKGPSFVLHPRFESAGTSSLLRRLEDFLVALRDGQLVVVDEIETSLHTDLCRALVHLFTDEQVNRRGAQLLFASHDPALMSSLRRDEIVLVDKARDGASSLHVASDFAGVRGRDDLRRAYELGRLGGVPVLGDLAPSIARALATMDHGS